MNKTILDTKLLKKNTLDESDSHLNPRKIHLETIHLLDVLLFAQKDRCVFGI